MSISATGLIDSGFATGTATGGTNTTIAGVGFSSTWTGRFVWITSGTGVGQAKYISAATSTTITIDFPWEINPDATSNFTITYNYADFITATTSTDVVTSQSRVYNLSVTPSFAVGGALADVRADAIVSSNNAAITFPAGCLWQHGRRLKSGKAVDGGSLIFEFSNPASFQEKSILGRLNIIGGRMEAKVGLGNLRFNSSGSGDGMTFIDAIIRNLYVVTRSQDTFLRTNFHGKPFWTKSATPPVSIGNAFIENSLIINGDGGAGDRHYFDSSFEGIPADSLFSKPFWVWKTTTTEGTYFWNAKYGGYATIADASLWYVGTPSGAGFHLGATVDLKIESTDTTPIADATIGLWDNNNDPAWMVGVESNGRPTRQLAISSNASGKYENPHITGESGLVPTARVKEVSTTDFSPFTYRVRKYGKTENTLVVSWDERSSQTTVLVSNTGITEANETTVDLYTTLETSYEFYDYVQHYLSLAANIKTDELLIISGDTINAGTYNLVIDAAASSVFAFDGATMTAKSSSFTGGMETEGTVSISSGSILLGGAFDCDVIYSSGASTTITNVTHTGAFDFTVAGTYTLVNTSLDAVTNSSGGAVVLNLDSTSSVATNTGPSITVNLVRTISITSIVAGSRLQIYNVTTSTEIHNAIVASTSYTATYNENGAATAGDAIRARLTLVTGVNAKLPYSVSVLANSAGISALAAQLADSVYDSNGVDGSAATGFSADYVNDEVDITVGANWRGIDFYAWWSYNLFLSQGISEFFGAVTAQDVANYLINSSTLNIFFDNSSGSLAVQNDNARIHRADGAYPVKNPTSGGGGVDVVWREKVLVTSIDSIGTAIDSVKVTVDLNLDSTVSSRATQISVDSIPTTVPTATQNADAVWAKTL